VNNAEQRFAGEIPREELGKQKAEHQFTDDRKRGEANRQPDRIQKVRIENQPAKIVSSGIDLRWIDREGIPIVEAKPEHINEWKETNEEHNDQRWRK
jgi:hypothetical protein